MMTKLKSRIDVPLIIIVLLAAFLNGYNIWTDRYANTYYTTAVASMLQNSHNFFYGSLDSAGSVTVDKPPLTFWIQTLSAYIFGLHGWSVILPQALAGFYVIAAKFNWKKKFALLTGATALMVVISLSWADNMFSKSEIQHIIKQEMKAFTSGGL